MASTRSAPAVCAVGEVALILGEGLDRAHILALRLHQRLAILDDGGVVGRQRRAGIEPGAIDKRRKVRPIWLSENFMPPFSPFRPAETKGAACKINRPALTIT